MISEWYSFAKVLYINGIISYGVLKYLSVTTHYLLMIENILNLVGDEIILVNLFMGKM